MILFYCSGWLSPGDDPLGYVTQVDNRIEAVTGLTMSTAEQLQVVNYGIGGHYEPHYDFSRVSCVGYIKASFYLIFRKMKMHLLALGLETE